MLESLDGNNPQSSIKCDEQKPHCLKCRTYGVVCNFASDIPDIQPLWGTGDKFQLQTYLCLGSPKASVSNAIWASDGVRFLTLDAHDHDLFTRFRYRTLYSLGGAELVNIYEQHILQAAFSVSSIPARGLFGALAGTVEPI